MEILYIHIKEYRNFIHQDFNFGGKYLFEYNQDIKELIISENHMYLEDFYSLQDKYPKGAIIKNLSSIIGENGAGKTSFFEFLKRNFISGNGGVEDDLIIAFREGDKFNIIHSESIPIVKDNAKDFGMILKSIKHRNLNDDDEIFSLSIPPRIKNFSNTDFIYFSNVFDDKPEQQLSGSFNISTNYLIRNDYSYKSEMSIINHNTDKRQLDHFKFEEINRQIALISGVKNFKNIIPFDLPEFLTIELSNDLLIHSTDLDKRLESTLSINDLKTAFQEIRFKFQDQDVKNFSQRIIINAFLNFLIDLFSISILNKKEVKEFSKLLKSEISRKGSLSEILQFTEIKLKSLLTTNLPEEFYHCLTGISDFMKFLESVKTSEKLDDIFATRPRKLEFPIDNQEIELLKQFYTNYFQSYQLRQYLDFNWRSLSSGQRALFSIYARFFSLTNSQLFGDGLSQNLIILMDEPDLYLHPQWQKSLISLLLDFFTVVFDKTTKGKQRSIQIFFTTNSPIPCSDLLSSNTIFLKLEKGKTRVSESLSEQKQTFAANIHTLFSDSFFLKNGLIGDFATNKIDAIIRKLNRLEDLNLKQRENMRKTILQIGEPIIKTKLIQMYNDRFNLDIHERLDRIEKNLKKDDKD